MKKSKVVWVMLSEKLEDGSRKTLDVKEICSCSARGNAEMILYHLRESSIYGRTENKETAADNEKMYFLAVQ